VKGLGKSLHSAEALADVARVLTDRKTPNDERLELRRPRKRPWEEFATIAPIAQPTN